MKERVIDIDDVIHANDNSHYRLALKLITKLLNKYQYPSSPPVPTTLSLYQEKYKAELSLHQWRDASDSLDTMIDLCPFEFHLYYNKGMLQLRLADYEGALMSFIYGLRLFPSSPALLRGIQTAKHGLSGFKTQKTITNDRNLLEKSSHSNFNFDCYLSAVPQRTLCSEEDICEGVPKETINKLHLLHTTEQSILTPPIFNLVTQLQMNIRDIEMIYEGNRYSNDLRIILSRAVEHLETLQPTFQSVIVFDIDDTALSSYLHMKMNKFKTISKYDLQFLSQSEAPSIPLILKFYKYTTWRGFLTVFLSERQVVYYNTTIRNLQQQGFNNPNDTLIMKPPNKEPENISIFKRNRREKLEKDGFSIVMTIGDQDSDFYGGFVGRPIKLPNYLYVVE